MKKILLICMVALFGKAQAGIIFDNSINNQLTISWNESFSVTQTPSYDGYYFLVVQDLFSSSDGQYWLDSNDSMTQSITINGTPVASNVWSGWQFRAGTEHNYDNNDLVMGVDGGSLANFSVGDSINWSGTMTIVDLNSIVRMPDVLDGFQTSAWIANYQGQYTNTIQTTVFTNAAPVPEPTSIAIFGLCLAGLSFIRKKKD